MLLPFPAAEELSEPRSLPTAGFEAFWVARKPSRVRWEVAAGRTVLDDCVGACRDRRGVKMVLLGV